MGILISTLQDVNNFLQRLLSHILWGTCNQASWLVRHNLKDIVFLPSRKHSYCVPIGNCQRLPTFSHHTHLSYQWRLLKRDDLSKQVQFLWEHNTTIWLMKSTVIQLEMGPGQVYQGETQWEQQSHRKVGAIFVHPLLSAVTANLRVALYPLFDDVKV